MVTTYGNKGQHIEPVASQVVNPVSPVSKRAFWVLLWFCIIVVLLIALNSFVVLSVNKPFRFYLRTDDQYGNAVNYPYLICLETSHRSYYRGEGSFGSYNVSSPCGSALTYDRSGLGFIDTGTSGGIAIILSKEQDGKYYFGNRSARFEHGNFLHGAGSKESPILLKVVQAEPAQLAYYQHLFTDFDSNGEASVNLCTDTIAQKHESSMDLLLSLTLPASRGLSPTLTLSVPDGGLFHPAANDTRMWAADSAYFKSLTVGSFRVVAFPGGYRAELRDYAVYFNCRGGQLYGLLSVDCDVSESEQYGKETKCHLKGVLNPTGSRNLRGIYMNRLSFPVTLSGVQ